MDLISNHFFRSGLFSFGWVLILYCLGQTAWAQSRAEMQILSMYYREKDLVVSATRHPKPISHVAENLAIVTGEEIEAMNAHTVAEVLDRIPGLFVNFNRDFGASSLLSIQGSEDRHVLVLMDGIPCNFMASGAAETNSIPVGTIARIEIIKGPASSAWGSSLGGVINVITKETGSTDKPTGSIRGSHGERSTKDYRGEASGKIGSVGYYLFAGHQKSDGLRGSRDFDNFSLYSKFRIPIVTNVEMDFTLGSTQPEINLGNYASEDFSSVADSRTSLVTASVLASLSKNISVDASFHHFNQKSTLDNKALGLGMTGFAGERFLNTVFDEVTTGGNGKLVWDHGLHTFVLGADFHRGKLDQTIHAGSLLQSISVPATTISQPKKETWALFANDTIVIDRWSITPGIRYDYDSITGSFVSPSLGITFSLGEDSVLRAAVARGFTQPPLSWTSGGALFLEPNPSLEPERIWSYQLGAETSAARYFWLKATVFQHEVQNALTVEPFGAGPPTFNDLYINNGRIRRKGIELEAETVPFSNISLRGGLTYVRIKRFQFSDTSDNYTYNMSLRYDDKQSLYVELFGHFIWRDLGEFFQPNFENVIWDLNLTKKMNALEKINIEIFFTAHNLFNGNQYILEDSQNPQRWLEAGLRIKF